MAANKTTLRELHISGVFLVETAQFRDERGFFSEVYNAAFFEEAGIRLDFVQDNHSHSVETGTLRGLHFQAPPFAQAKLVRVSRGSVFDVAVDIRRGSPTYGRHVAEILSAENWRQLLVPAGLAHGFCTLEPDTEVLYKVSAPYARDYDHGLAWNDPALGISWPISEDAVITSTKDRTHPRLTELKSPFSFDA
jgi:dTDP-4-dehydrorhamnose 3,5-epimerase